MLAKSQTKAVTRKTTNGERCTVRRFHFLTLPFYTIAAIGFRWTEWAKIEVRPLYSLPEHRTDYAGLLISLARQEWPDISGYNAPEVVWRLQKKNHAGLIVRSPRYERVEELMREYTKRFYKDFFARQPLPARATE